MVLVSVPLLQYNELYPVEKNKTLYIYLTVSLRILRNDPVIWKVKNLLQASTNSANDHYCRWKADKASHFPNFITVLPFLYSPPTSLLSVYCWFYSLWASKSGSVLSLTVKVLEKFTKRIQLKQKTLQNLLVEFRLNSSVEVVRI